MNEQTKLNYNDAGHIQLLSNDALIKIALGKINITKVAKEEIAARGFDKQNQWVGFAKAESEWSFE